MPIEKSAGAVVFRKEKGMIKYLLLLHGLGHWDFPKGWIERGEKLLETAKREIKEETGIKDIEFMPGFKENIKYFFQWEDKKILKIVTFFLAETKNKKVKISYEHKEYKWLPYNKASGQLTFQSTKEVLKKANQFLLPQNQKSKFKSQNYNPKFKNKIYQIVRNVPRGKVLTYKEVAKLAGRPKAFRAVGNILNKNYDAKIPCYRVVRSDGRVGGYNRGQKKKIELLKNEGVRIKGVRCSI